MRCVSYTFVAYRKGGREQSQPRRDVRRLPDTAESIFCAAEISTSVSGSSILFGPPIELPFGNLSCLWPCEGLSLPYFAVASWCSSDCVDSDRKPDIQFLLSTSNRCSGQEDEIVEGENDVDDEGNKKLPTMMNC